MSTLKTNNIQHVDRSDPSIIINTDGSVNIAGTMTYEDVTNVDSVGIITGRELINAQRQVHVGTGVSIKAGGLDVTGITTITKGTSGGAAANTDAALIIDNSSNTYVQFRTPDSVESGLLFGDDADNDAGAVTYNHSSNHLGFRVNASERVRIDESGFVGIENTSPNSSLSGARNLVIGSGSGDRGLTIMSGTSGVGHIEFSDGTGSSAEKTAGGIRYYHNSNYMRFNTNGGTEQVRIDSDGRVLIGTTNNTPAASNQAGIVFGDNTAGVATKGIASFCANGAAPLLLTRRVSDGNVLGIADDTTTLGFLRVNSNDFEIRSTNNMRFQTGGGNERVRITSGGQTLFTGVSGTTPLDIKTSNANNNTVQPIIESYADNSTYKARIGLVREGSSGLLGWAFLTNAVGSPTEKLRITSAGRVLIGTTNDTSHNFTYSWNPKLQFESASTSDYARFSLVYNGNDSVGPGILFGKSRGTSIGSHTLVTDGDQIGGLFFQAADGTDKHCRTATIICYVDGATGGNDTPGRLEFSTTSDGASDSTERLRIAKDGEVTFKNKGGGTIKIGGLSAHHSKLVIADNAGTGNGNLLIEGGDGSDFLNIASNGGIKIADAVASSHSAKVAIEHSGINPNGLFVLSNHASFQGTTLQSNASRNTTNGSYIHFKCAINGVADKFRVLDNGNCANTNNSFSSLSDETLKENIVDAGSQWNDIKNIRVRKFNFKEGVDPEKPTLLGVIAQEAELVCPNLIESNVQMQAGVEQEYKTFKYSVLYMKAIKCLQEAQAKIETLESKVAALEGS